MILRLKHNLQVLFCQQILENNLLNHPVLLPYLLVEQDVYELLCVLVVERGLLDGRDEAARGHLGGRGRGWDSRLRGRMGSRGS